MRFRIVAMLLLLVSTVARADEPRLIVVISDLHFGLGKSNGVWHPKEDFRWSTALRSFCDAISKEGNDHVDLVVAGDFLELWQFPTGKGCAPSPPDAGCKVSEIAELTRMVVDAHGEDFRILGAFANRGQNRLHIVPGNHDAALMEDAIWKLVEPAFAAKAGRVIRVSTGIWRSSGGEVVVEHGHQIAPDVNAYASWPKVTKGDRMWRPWGEFFVQRLYNDEEDDYPTIDNLVSSSAGVKYRIADRGKLLSALDVARFVNFALYETSIRQRISSLGTPPPGEKKEWDVAYARKRGHRLVLDALAPGDPLRAVITDGAELQSDLDVLVADARQIGDDEIRGICDQVAARRNAGSKVQLCRDPSLGYGLHAANIISRERVMRSHLRKRLVGFPAMRAFVYGHTHAVEDAWTLDVTDLRKVTIANTGAFQRVVDDEKFAAAAVKKDITPVEALRKLSVADLPPCHTAVVVRVEDGRPKVEVRNWIEEKDAGRFGGACDMTCSRISRNCPDQ